MLLLDYYFGVAYSELFETSKMELFMKIIDSCQPLPIFATSSILDLWYDCEWTSGLGNLQNFRNLEVASFHLHSLKLLDF